MSAPQRILASEAAKLAELARQARRAPDPAEVLRDPWRGERSPKIESLHRAYTAMGLFSWTNERVGALASSLGVTVQELCAMAGQFRTEAVSSYQRRKAWPCYLAMHFAGFEQAAKNRGLS